VGGAILGGGHSGYLFEDSGKMRLIGKTSRQRNISERIFRGGDFMRGKFNTPASNILSDAALVMLPE